MGFNKKPVALGFPHRAWRYRPDVPGLLGLEMYKNISDPGMRSYPLMVPLALRTPGWSLAGRQRRVGAFTPCEALSTPGIAGSVPGLLEL